MRLLLTSLLCLGRPPLNGSQASTPCKIIAMQVLYNANITCRFNNNNGVLKSSCSQWNVPNNSDDEIKSLSQSIQSVASTSGVDARFILAIVMQESNGCVRAPTTNNGVRNPGLMQDHNGAGTCNDASVSNPCPSDQITKMIKEGVEGTPYGDGLKQLIAQSGASDVSKYYKAARMYNSGSIDASGNLGAGIATHCYASDIANRLLGWSSGPSSCEPGTVGSLSRTVGSIPDTGSSSPDPVVSSSPSVPSVPATTAQVAPVSTSAVAGGAFAEITGAKGVDQPTPTPSSIPAPVSSPSPTADPVIATPPVVTPTPPVAESTVIVLPTPAASTPVSEKPAPTPTSKAPTSSTPKPTTSPVVSGVMTGSCTTEGLWNCIGGKSFQQCASGTWSVVQNLAAGMKCTEGQSKIFGVSSISKRQQRRKSVKFEN